MLDTPAWLVFTGQSSAEAKGYGWLDAIHPEDHDHVQWAWREAHASGGNYETEYRLRRYDGVWRNIRSRGVPVGEGRGKKREYVGTCIDITERNLAEAARRESEIRLRLTTDALPVLISYVDAQQRYRFTNAAYFEWFGFSPPEGAAIGDVVDAQTYAARLPYIQRALSGEAVIL